MSDANERLNEILISSIEKLDGAVDKGVEFAAEQAPDLIQQLLLWHGVKSALGFTLSVLVLIACVVLYRMGWVRIEGESDSTRAGVRGGGGFFACVVSLICIGGVVNNIDWLMILIAPKLYLLEYAAELVK